MLSLEVLKVSSELIHPLTRRFMPQAARRFLRGLGFSLGHWSRTVQARLPEPVLICIKLLLAWILLVLLFVPGIGKFVVGAIIASAAKRKMQRPKP